MVSVAVVVEPLLLKAQFVFAVQVNFFSTSHQPFDGAAPSIFPEHLVPEKVALTCVL